MYLDLTKVSSKGQIVIPQRIREKASLEEGECLAIFEHEELIILKKVPSPWNTDASKALAHITQVSKEIEVKHPSPDASSHQRSYIH